MNKAGMACRIVAGMMLLSMAAAAQPSDSVIKSGDVVYVEVYRVSELTQSTQVDGQGNITLPYVGSVMIAGLTESAAAAKLSQSLKKILRNPRVTVRKSALTAQPTQRFNENMQMAIIPLQNANAESMYNVLNNMSSTGGTISFDPNTNSLLITDTPSSLQSMSEIARQLDKMESQLTQVRIQAKFAEVQMSAIKEMGIRWFAQGDQLSGGFIPPPTRTLGVSNMRGGLSPSAGENVATNNGSSVNGSNVGREFVNNPFTQRLNIPVQVPVPGQTFLGFASGGIDLGVILDMLAQDGEAEVLANPMTVTVNHQQAVIKMVDKIPYTEFGTEITGATSFSTRFLDAGITLDVTPHVYQDDRGPYIKLELNPEVSFPVGANNGVPILSVRSTSNVANVRDKQTLVVGGIVNENEQKVVTKLPGLGDLPMIGKLFKRKEKTKERTELVIFVTPTIYQHPEDITWDKMIDVAEQDTDADSDGTARNEKVND
jgi:type II secretory pathway component GspD/PulD (secretin)